MHPPAWTPRGHLPLDQALDTVDQLVVRQSKDWTELFTDLEASNRYAVVTPDGSLAAMMLERSAGAGGFFLRWFLKAGRPFEMGVYAYETPHAFSLWLKRPWTWFLSRIEVSDGNLEPLGVIQQRWSWFRRRFDVKGPDGRPLARIEGPLLRPWTFLIRAPWGERELGRIAKQWPGGFGELLTDADTYVIAMPEGAALRRLVLAAAVLIDFKYFESRD